MAYKNLLLRLFFSFIFVILYFSIVSIDFGLVYFLILIIYIIIILEVFFYFKKYRFIPLIYIVLSLGFFLTIDFNLDNFLFFNFYIFLNIIFDIFSYIIGKLFGKNKLIKISPKKTVEGLLGGFIFSLLLSLILAYIINLNIDFSLIIFSILIIICAFVGDIIESFFKRKNNLKDSSELIPGHGGVFDRFDSFLFSIIFYSISVNFLQ